MNDSTCYNDSRPVRANSCNFNLATLLYHWYVKFYNNSNISMPLSTAFSVSMTVPNKPISGIEKGAPSASAEAKQLVMCRDITMFLFPHELSCDPFSTSYSHMLLRLSLVITFDYPTEKICDFYGSSGNIR